MSAECYRERFFAAFERGGGCWNWNRSIGSHGYGAFWNGTRVEPAHRQSWLYHRGAIPPGKMVLHRCDNKQCVNPSHLYIGDRSQNMIDAIGRGQRNYDSIRGKRGPNHKLTEAQARAIYVAQGTLVEIGERFGINYSTVAQIKHRKTWKHVNGEANV